MRISDTWQSEMTLEGDQQDALDVLATFDIEGSYHSARHDKSAAVSAEFVSAQWGGLTITRDMAILICGADYLRRVEERVAEEYVRDQYPECAA